MSGTDSEREYCSTNLACSCFYAALDIVSIDDSDTLVIGFRRILENEEESKSDQIKQE